MKLILCSIILIFAMFLASCAPADINEPIDSDVVPANDDDSSKPGQDTEEEDTEKPIEQETREVGGTFEEWKEIIEENAPGSAAEQAFLDCNKEMSKLVETCSQYGGWMVDNIMEVKDLQTGKVYEYSDLAKDGCDQTDRTKIDSQLIDSQTEGEYQVICSINCYSWKCPVKKNWKVTIKGIGNSDPEFGQAFSSSSEVSFSTDNTKLDATGETKVTIDDKFIGCAGNKEMSEDYELQIDATDDEVTFSILGNAGLTERFPISCDFGEGTTQVTTTFDFKGKSITLDLESGATKTIQIPLGGDPEVDMEWTFTLE